MLSVYVVRNWKEYIALINIICKMQTKSRIQLIRESLGVLENFRSSLRIL